MSDACHDAGGIRVTYKILKSDSSNELVGVLLKCIENDPGFIVFSCLLSTSFEEI
ncbi:hypothetical protein lpl1088 [Legionella pneumophila str. Lens]|uniref:Uncharacterized protein n=1 Tax=Legionella pneumophila (strain Lens) TaxID=297245 RepID=Q5WXK7_LEGPL|nr:hypothetical protein lpl1088 [Legionella pneumophila str. Lens]